LITSSLQGGVTTRHGGLDGHHNSNSNHNNAGTGPARHDTGPSAALLDKVRALDALPRLGALRTLDLKGNDLRVGFLFLSCLFWVC
jgi:protein phosphatase 1 regulatory subunit 37